MFSNTILRQTLDSKVVQNAKKCPNLKKIISVRQNKFLKLVNFIPLEYSSCLVQTPIHQIPIAKSTGHLLKDVLVTSGNTRISKLSEVKQRLIVSIFSRLGKLSEKQNISERQLGINSNSEW